MSKFRNLAIIMAIIAVFILVTWLSNISAQTQSTTIVCPSGQKPQTVASGTTGVKVTCVASIATPTPTPTPTPVPTPTPIVCTVTCGATVATTGTLGVSVQFASGTTISNCGGNASFDWNFGDGTNAYSQNQVHTYSATGSYTWTLAVNVPGTAPCIKSGTITITAVAPTPTPTPPLSGTVEMPRVLLNSAMPTLTGSMRIASDSASFQSALIAAQPGDTIQLTAGTTYTAPTNGFVLPTKATAGWILIRSSNLSALPENTRVSPSNAAQMPRIVSSDNTPALITAPGAAFWRLSGIEFTHTSSALTAIVRLGSYSATTQAQSASDITIDRCYIHGTATSTTRRGVELQGARIAIVDSHISDCHEVGADSQAICGWNGAGPFKIVNNYLEGAGENVMFGGADPSIPNLVPSDIEFRRNLVFKPQGWKSSQWSIKNLFELKNAQRLWIDGNTFDGIWPAAQAGFAILMKSVSQDGTAPWSRTGDVTFTNNVIRNSFGGINLLGTPADQPAVKMTRVLIRNNQFTVTGDYWALVSEVADLTMDKNTVTNSGSLLQTYGAPSLRFIFTGNAANNGPYGFKGDGAGSGGGTLTQYFPGCIFTGNAIIGGSGMGYPAGNFFVATAGTGADGAAITAAQNRP